ncbi:MAG TPA: hypothetical protein VG125_25960, partial [Pirellulales bacterium]|nr:hypothetical protein [Pirellulales bacterium]
MSLDSLLDRLAGQQVTPRRKKRLRPARFHVEMLENRALLTTYTVTTTVPNFFQPGDNDHIGLLSAIQEANQHSIDSPPDVINFAIPTTDPGYNPATGVWTIQMTNSIASLRITHPVTIDGTSQKPGHTLGPPVIDIDGTKAPGTDGLEFKVGGNTVKGLIINNFSGTGLILDGTGDTRHGQGPGINNTIQDDWIGTDATGKKAASNHFGGIQIFNSSYNLIGGLNSGGQLTTGDLISGNGQNGVFLASALDSHNYIEGNYIGTDITGLAPIAGAQSASYGVGLVPPLLKPALGYPSNNFIGDFDPTEQKFDPNGRNIIAGNTADGVLVVGGTGNQITGNYIGIGPDGTTPVGNAEDGILLEDAYSNIVGGTQANTRNVISANGHNGVAILADSVTQYGLAIPVAKQGGSLNIVLGNYIGTDADGLVTSILAVDAQGNKQTKFLGNAEDGVLVSNDSTDPSVSMSQNVIGGTNTNSQLTAGNLISGNADGVLLNGARVTLTTVEGNFIGTDNSGTHTLANSNAGVEINTFAGETGPSNNFIGVPGAGNLISGNGTPAVGTSGQAGFTPASGEGVLIDNGSNGNFVEGNQIGTTPNGLAKLPNVKGVLIADSSGNVVGGTQAGDANLISGNSQHGVVIAGDSSNNNKVYENSIGLDSSGGPLGNGDAGVLIQTLASDNFVGGTQTVGGVTTSLGNTIAANGIGVAIQSRAHDNQVIGNLIGSSRLASGLSTNAALGNAIGVDILDADSNPIGGLTSAVRSGPARKLTDVAANIIVNSAADGVEIADTNGIAGNPQVVTTGNVVEGNYVGIENDGSTKLANGGNGVQILSAAGN